MKRIAFIFLRLLVVLYAIVAFPIWIFTIILWTVWVMLLSPLDWVLFGGWTETNDDKKYEWLVNIKWWREKLKWDEYSSERYDFDIVPLWYLYYLHKMIDYCE